MKSLKIVFALVLLAFCAVSCGTEDDLCISGEATPRLKIKFKTKATGKMKTLDSLFIAVDYGNGIVPVVGSTTKTDSVLVPLRVDDASSTKMFVGTSRKAVTSQITLRYTTSAEYVSPACGIKKLYHDFTAELDVPNSVIGVEVNQTEITDEGKTHLFLLF